MEAKRETHNLSDFLGIKDDADDHRHDDSGTSGGLTLLAILSDKPAASASCRGPHVPLTAARHPIQSNAAVSEHIQQPPSISRDQSNRTLLDILREEQTSITPLSGSHHRDHWSLLKNIKRLYHRRSSNVDDRTASHGSTSNPHASPGTIEEAPARMSLIALLEENDRQTGLDGFESFGHMTYADNGEEEINGEHGSSSYFVNCCVCMVRHKGAAFIPCGHTFCRLCSRELWVQRGNCPLCNNNILEILDIF